LSVLAALTIVELVERKLPARAVLWLAPATLLAMLWWAIPDLRNGVGSLSLGRRLDTASVFGLRVGLGAALVLLVAVQPIDRWARQEDARRRALLRIFLGLAVVLTIGTGLREIGFRHKETAELLGLREAVLQRQAVQPFRSVALLGPVSGDWDEESESQAVAGSPGRPAPGGQLRFVLRSALPTLHPRDALRLKDIDTAGATPRLVVLAGSGVRLSYAAQARLRLESIYPSRGGNLDAYATQFEEPSASRTSGAGRTRIR
jgi:hypothetical protein